MRRKQGKNIGYKKERVVLSDILPYEVPPFFSNRNLYYFLVKYKVELNESIGIIRFKKDNTNTTGQIVKLLFGIDFKQKCNKEKSKYDYYKLKRKDPLMTIPFKFRITHKNNDYRELNVIHPVNQIRFINFYDKYKNTILYYSDISRFSLRKPSKVSSLKYFKDKTNKSRKSKNQDVEIIETTDKEYTSLKTYFSYQKYSNIFQFYESYEYQRAEKRFDSLLKFDISKCFDSIYTHTLPWALFNKKIVKDNLNNKRTFGHQFDELMQKMNYNETNGIVIGPEFSRIFAELILQRIDKNVEKELYKKGYRYKEDYDIYRYVDDFFVFYNDEKIKSEISSLYNIKLQEYNLYINDSKTKPYIKPIITDITIAKEKIRVLVEHSMIFQIIDKETKNQIGLKYYKAKDIITNYKSILSTTNTGYKDLQNYFLVIIYNKLKSIISKIQQEQKKLLVKYSQLRDLNERLKKVRKKQKEKLKEEKEQLNEEIRDQEKFVKTYHRQIVINFIEIIELTFFIYTVLPRVSYSIKVCQILYRIIDFVKNQETTKQIYLSNHINASLDEIQYLGVNFDTKHEIFKKIFDGISLVFKSSKTKEYAEVETLYLLQIVRELGIHYQFNEDLINGHFRIYKEDNSQINTALNYFTIISVLNYIRRDKRFSNTRRLLRRIILDKFKNFESNKAEDVLLLIDVLNCPYVAVSNGQVTSFRRKILEEIKFFDVGVSRSDQNKIINEIANFTSDWFFSWKENDLGKELNTKRGHNVY